MLKFTIVVDKVLSNILIVLMAGIVLTVTWQVITRFIMTQPSSYTEELARFLLIWIGLLGASWALRNRSHLGIDLISSRISKQGKQLLVTGVYFMIILFTLAIMVIGGSRLVNLTFTLNQTSAAMGVKMGYIYLVVPLSGLIMTYYSGLVIYQVWRNRNPQKDR